MRAASCGLVRTIMTAQAQRQNEGWENGADSFYLDLRRIGRAARFRRRASKIGYGRTVCMPVRRTRWHSRGCVRGRLAHTLYYYY